MLLFNSFLWDLLYAIMNLKVTWFILFAFVSSILKWYLFLFFGSLETSFSHRIVWSNSEATTLQTQGRSSSKLSQWLSSTLSILNFLWEWSSFLLCTRALHSVEHIFATKHFVLFTNREWSFSYNGESNSYSKSACISHTVLDDHCSQFESHLTWTLCSG